MLAFPLRYRQSHGSGFPVSWLTPQHRSQLAGGRSWWRCLAQLRHPSAGILPGASRWGSGSWFPAGWAERPLGEGRYKAAPRLAFWLPYTRMVPSHRDHKIPKKPPNDRNPTIFSVRVLNFLPPCSAASLDLDCNFPKGSKCGMQLPASAPS